MSRSEATVEELLQFLPPTEELEVLRLRLFGSAIPDPSRAWDSSSAYSTVDKRILGPDEVQHAIEEAEKSLHEYVTFLHEGLRPVFRSFFEGRSDEAVSHLIALGERHEKAGRVKSARQCYNTALTLSLPVADKTAQTLALRRIARVALSLGDLAEATAHYARAAELAEDSGDVLATAIARTGIGNVQMFQGRWADAEDSYTSALGLLSQLPEEAAALERGQIYNNLGNAASRRGRYADAEVWLNRAQELWARVDSPFDLAVCSLNLGQLRQEQGRYDDARAIYTRALELPIWPGIRSNIASDMAELLLVERRIAEAEHWGRVAEEMAIAAGSPYNIGHMYLVRGKLAAAAGEDDGFTFYEKALEIAREKGYPFLEAEVLLEYAELRRRTGGSEEAEAYLERALELFDAQGSVQNHAQAKAALDRIRAEVAAAAPLAGAAD